MMEFSTPFIRKEKMFNPLKYVGLQNFMTSLSHDHSPTNRLRMANAQIFLAVAENNSVSNFF